MLLALSLGPSDQNRRDAPCAPGDPQDYRAYRGTSTFDSQRAASSRLGYSVLRRCASGHQTRVSQREPRKSRGTFSHTTSSDGRTRIRPAASIRVSICFILSKRASVNFPGSMVPDFVHPVLLKPIHELLSDVLKTLPVGSPAMIKVMPFPTYHHPTSDPTPPVAHVPDIPPTLTYWKFPPSRSVVSATKQASPPRRTRLMATLNVTPDSFSDGLDHTTLGAALNYATTSAAAGGADIIDVGGYSTRPGAAYVSPDEEKNRVVPVIAGIRASPPPDNTTTGKMNAPLISVDTFRPDVARAAVLAGANCINDVHAFTGPDYPPTSPSASAYFADMKKTTRELGVPVILMHSRGDAGANKDYSHYDSVLQGVAKELGEKVEAIVRGPGGLRRWLVMVDPGVGFSKSLEGNLQVLRESASITADVRTEDGVWNPLRGYPLLIGVSRKSFLGAILSQPDEDGTYQGRQTTPKERGWATATAVACAVQQGAAVVRVHDVHELDDVVRVADAIWS
jgi:dihydroneopterin aldolase / 2-amino-4-hydroxy-6-hydroxymethyldihydropteridine diphosphokinase / dihydropteroate synthase